MLVGISVTSGLPPVRGGHDIQVVKKLQLLLHLCRAGSDAQRLAKSNPSG